MKAVRIHAFGGPESLIVEDVPCPVIGEATDVLVHVHAAGVNPVDRAIRAGYLRGMIDHSLPLTLGLDLSGTVTAIGPDVTDFAVGDAIYGCSNPARLGTYAEEAVVSASEIALKPASLDFISAAAVPLAALTAWQMLEAAGLQAGQTILIHGAGGGVGTFAVQFAHLRGARVLGTAASDKLDLVHELGADEAIDYTTTRFEEVAHDVDVVLASVAGDMFDRSWDVIKPGGWLISPVTPVDATAARARGIHGMMQVTQMNADHLVEIARLIDAGKVRPVVSAVIPLMEARRAHEIGDRGHTRGKTVLSIRE